MVRQSDGGPPSAAQMTASLQVPSALTFATPCVDLAAPPALDLQALQKLCKPEIRAILVDMLARENELRLSPLVRAIPITH